MLIYKTQEKCKKNERKIKIMPVKQRIGYKAFAVLPLNVRSTTHKNLRPILWK